MVLPPSHLASRPGRLPPAELAWVAHVVGNGATVQKARAMGAATTDLWALDIRSRGGRHHRTVLRRFTSDRLSGDPWYRPEHEAAVLRMLERTPVLAPRLLGANLGPGADPPLLLTTRLGGRPPRRPGSLAVVVDELARELTVIHGLESPSLLELPAYEPYYPAAELSPPAWSSRPEIWQAAIDATKALPPSGRRFIHRDYHQANALFRRGQLTGVVDWLTACRGPVAIDLARMRANLATQFGPPWPERFLEAYRRLASWPIDDLRAWELIDCADIVPELRPPGTRADARRWDRLEGHVAAVAMSG